MTRCTGAALCRRRGGRDDREVVARPGRVGEGGAYEDYLHRTGMPDYLATPGSRGAWMLRRREGDVGHFLLITIWESMQAIEAFAGVPVERARCYPEDENFLLEQEPIVVHYDVTHGGPGFGPGAVSA